MYLKLQFLYYPKQWLYYLPQRTEYLKGEDIYITFVSVNYILGVISLKQEPVKMMYDKVVRKIQNESLHGQKTNKPQQILQNIESQQKPTDLKNIFKNPYFMTLWS